MSKVIVLWHAPSNSLAVAEVHRASLPLITVLDDDFTGINPFYSYPLNYLMSFGWIYMGEL